MAAPLGYKDFTTGEVLTANDVDGYLMQGIWVFANATARDAAVTSPQEGNACYLKDTDVIQVYSGSSWATQSASNPISANIVDAKGDLIAATAADTVARLAVGTNGQVLTADSTAATGIKWATPAGGGKVLQVVNATYGVETTSSSSTYADTGLTATITPTSATSKILVIVSQQGVQKATNTTAAVEIKLQRAGSDILTLGDGNGFTNTTSFAQVGSVSASYLDSPATTSATIYKTQFRSTANNAAAYVQSFRTATDSAKSTITLMEIGA
jgi:hypothetical protein